MDELFNQLVKENKINLDKDNDNTTKTIIKPTLEERKVIALESIAKNLEVIALVSVGKRDNDFSIEYNSFKCENDFNILKRVKEVIEKKERED